MSEVIEAIATRFQGTHDIAGVAEAIEKTASGQFEWDNDSRDLASADTLAKFWDLSRMNCFEFVHFCAYLCGDHPILHGQVRLGASGGSAISRWYDTMAGEKFDDVVSISRGTVVVGVAKNKKNNVAGFFHIGIAVGTTDIISLSQVTTSIAPSSRTYSQRTPGSAQPTAKSGLAPTDGPRREVVATQMLDPAPVPWNGGRRSSCWGLATELWPTVEVFNFDSFYAADATDLPPSRQLL